MLQSAAGRVLLMVGADVDEDTRAVRMDRRRPAQEVHPRVYGNFDIILDHCFRPHPPHVACDVLPFAPMLVAF